MRTAATIGGLAVWALVASPGCGWWASEEPAVGTPPDEATDDEGKRRGKGGKGRRRGDKTPKPAPVAGACGVWGTPGIHTVEVTHHGKTSPVRVVVPEDRRHDTLVLVLHGGGSTSERVLRHTGYGQLAGREGFVVAAPEGVVQPGSGKRKWNSGKADLAEARDDVAFLDAVAAQARRDGCVDVVAAVGFSNGGQMAMRWACQGSEVDAVVSAAGGLLVDGATCTGPKPILVYVGEDDSTYRESPTETRDLPSVEESVAWWRGTNACGGEPVTRSVGKTTCEKWSCDQPLRFCVTDDMGHEFPRADAGGVDATEDSWQWIDKVTGP